MTAKVDIEGILKTLTLEEKISILAGKNMWETVPIPAKGVPSIKTSDGPNGARGADFIGGVTSACFPAACSVAATFDEDLAQRIGSALAEETRSKGARCLLGPTTCMHRDPRGGRNFESFSEDPLLAGRLAASVVRGLQSRGVAATIKHFAANEQEQDRMSVRETVSERALREIYLRPFEIAIKEAGPWAVMTAYNIVNGFHCDENEFLLDQVLRGEWGWDGLVMSDWGGTNSVDGAINAGLDLEMPGPARVRKIDTVVEAVKAGKIQESKIDERARRVLKFIEQLKAFEDDTIPPEQAIDKPEHRALIREAGGRGIVLCKNDKNILPLSKDKLKGKKVALIGYAKQGQAHGGGSAAVNAHYKKSPWDALHETYGDSVEFTYAQGAHTVRMLPALADNVVGLDGKPGWTLNFYDQGSTTVRETKSHPSASCSAIGSDSSKPWTTFELIADFTPAESGEHYFAASGLGPTRIYIDDAKVWEQTSVISDPMGFLFMSVNEEEHRRAFSAGTTYRVRIVSEPPASLPGLEILTGRTGFRMGFQTAGEHDRDLQTEAVRLAREADYAVVFSGHTPEWESEGQDQVSFHLPRQGSQDALIAAVADAQPNTVVVNSTGVAVAMPWLGKVGALLQAWYPGQECGNAIADVLSGAVNPEGRLPCSFPKHIEDVPAYGNFPGNRDANGVLNVEYKEGVFIGYRHYDRLPREKLNFPFGYGLSYTSFSTSGLKVEKQSDDAYAVSVTVKNTGSQTGGSLVQLYGGRAEKVADTPDKALVAFKKVRLQPGESTTVQLSFSTRDLGFFDEKAKRWVVPAGKYSLKTAESASDIIETVEVVLEKELTYAP